MPDAAREDRIMGFMSKLFGSRDAHHDEDAPPCPHVSLLPRWESVADMGDDSKASGFDCQSCGAHFTPQEGHALRQSEGERVKELAETH
jgi:hypothetical protein